MLTKVFLIITCAMFAFIYLIDAICLEKKEITLLSVNGVYYQIAIFIVGLSYCIWKDLCLNAARKQN
ncbi:hypothetical protein D3C81_2014340 [compost metagenome]